MQQNTATVFETRYRPTRRLGVLLAVCAAFLPVALLPVPWPIAVLDVGFFGYIAVFSSG